MLPKQDCKSCGCEEDDELVLKSTAQESVLSTKTGRDKSNPSLWHENPIFHHNEVFLHERLIQQEKTASLPSPFSFPFLPSSLLYPPHHPSSSTDLHHPQKSQTLPSFTTSFLRPLHYSSFSPPLLQLKSQSSSLHPLPSSFGTFPSLPHAGGRKGRVSCGVCGKSFYDKGEKIP